MKKFEHVYNVLIVILILYLEIRRMYFSQDYDTLPQAQEYQETMSGNI